MEIVKTQHLFLDSAKRDAGTPQSWSVAIPAGMLKCRPDQHLRVQLCGFSYLYDFNAINGTNNIFFVTDTAANTQTAIYMDYGCPTLQQLGKQLVTKFAEIGITAVIRFHQYNNSFEFSFDREIQLTFSGTSYNVLGFNEGEEPIGFFINSTHEINLQPVTDLCVKLDGVSPVHNLNIDNLRGEVRSSSLLLCLYTGNIEPYTYIDHRSKDDEFTIDLVDTELLELRFAVTDMEDKPIPIADHKITLRVDTVQARKETFLLQGIQRALDNAVSLGKDWFQWQFLSSQIK